MIKVSEPWIGEKEKNEVIKVIESGMLVQGEKVKEFEDRFKEYLGVKNAIAVNSATSGLYSAVGALGIGPGDEVIVSPYTMSASATCALIYNAIPVFADIETEKGLIEDKVAADCVTLVPNTAVLVIDMQGSFLKGMDEKLKKALAAELKPPSRRKAPKRPPNKRRVAEQKQRKHKLTKRLTQHPLNIHNLIFNWH